MVLGIGFIGVLTATITSAFLDTGREAKKSRSDSRGLSKQRRNDQAARPSLPEDLLGHPKKYDVVRVLARTDDEPALIDPNGVKTAVTD